MGTFALLDRRYFRLARAKPSKPKPLLRNLQASRRGARGQPPLVGRPMLYPTSRWRSGPLDGRRGVLQSPSGRSTASILSMHPDQPGGYRHRVDQTRYRDGQTRSLCGNVPRRTHQPYGSGLDVGPPRSGARGPARTRTFDSHLDPRGSDGQVGC